jgi:cysteine-rich repeat protein
MRKTIFTGTIAVGLLATVLLTAGSGLAANGDCGQPVTNGARPTATDCLHILRTSVSLETCDPTCICDTNNSTTTTATDALICLQFAVSTPGVVLNCGSNCPPKPMGDGCTSAELFALAGSDLDTGWTGLAHNSEIVEGASITFSVLRRCTGNDAVCLEDSDCVGQGTCEATCDCDTDTICEASGPTTQQRCITTLTECTTNADCPSECGDVFGPPLPLSSGGTGTCVITLFEEPITGTVDSSTGQGQIAATLRSRVYLGNVDQPCPRCGTAAQNPEVGEPFTCQGGQRNGLACTVDAVSPVFGGVSYDCAPPLNANVSGVGLAIRFDNVTTGTTEAQATLPCAFGLYRDHPDRGTGACTDTLDACDTNADCMRCDGNETISCTSNTDCGANGPCAFGPDTSVTCGYYCHCGFCEENGTGIQDPDLPCYADSQCPGGFTCQPGNGGNTGPNPFLAAQAQPNQCTTTLCGTTEKEKCPETFRGSCSDEPFRTCDPLSPTDTCQTIGAGTCVAEFLPCFEGKISRSGVPSPLGSYCSGGSDPDTVCTSNADCSEGVCTPNSSRATSAALFCVGATSSSAVNSAGGITGPGAIRLKNFIKTCYCGDGEIGCDEECDDGNRTDGDGCSKFCADE